MYRVVYYPDKNVVNPRFPPQPICTDGKPNLYGTPKDFKTKKAAQEWIDKNSYPGMSIKYEIREKA